MKKLIVILSLVAALACILDAAFGNHGPRTHWSSMRYETEYYTDQSDDGFEVKKRRGKIILSDKHGEELTFLRDDGIWVCEGVRFLLIERGNEIKFIPEDYCYPKITLYDKEQSEKTR